MDETKEPIITQDEDNKNKDEKSKKNQSGEKPGILATIFGYILFIIVSYFILKYIYEFITPSYYNGPSCYGSECDLMDQDSDMRGGF